MDYNSADGVLQGRCHKQRKIGNNTYLVRTDDGIALRLHSTDILLCKADGSMVLNSGGWQTVTTKARLNDNLPHPWRVTQERGVWWLTNADSGERWQWEDGVTISSGGDVTGAERYTPDADKARRKMATAINRYAKDFVSELLAGNVPAPSGGDCWFCSMFDRGITHATTDGSHIASHIEERYYVPSLLLRAIEAFPVSPAAKWALSQRWQGQPADWSPQADLQTWARDVVARQLQASVARWCKRQLGFAS